MNMKLKTLLGAALTSACMLGAASSQAAYVYDGWQIDTNGAGLASHTVNIGEVSLSGGVAQVTQQLIGGAPIPGSRFSEFGAIFSISYIMENAPGANDFGSPDVFDNNLKLQITFSGLQGIVTSFNPVNGALDYAFTGFGAGGGMLLQGRLSNANPWVNLAAFSNPSGGGDLNGFLSNLGTNGDSSLDVQVASMVPGLFKDSNGVALDPLVLASRLFLGVRTNNEISSPASAPFACEMDGNLATVETCVNLTVLSNGSANLIPEPTVLGLLGAGLLGLGLSRRRKSKAA